MVCRSIPLLPTFSPIRSVTAWRWPVPCPPWPPRKAAPVRRPQKTCPWWRTWTWLAAAILFVIASGQAGFAASAGFASNGYGDHSPGKYTLVAALVTEVVGIHGRIEPIDLQVEM